MSLDVNREGLAENCVRIFGVLFPEELIFLPPVRKRTLSSLLLGSKTEVCMARSKVLFFTRCSRRHMNPIKPKHFASNSSHASLYTLNLPASSTRYVNSCLRLNGIVPTLLLVLHWLLSVSFYSGF